MEKELILCDTNIFISWFAGRIDTINTLESIGLDNILIPSIRTMELIQGIRNKREQTEFREKLKKVSYHSFQRNNFSFSN